MPEYIFKYKCRCCGKVFDCGARTGKTIAETVVYQIAAGFTSGANAGVVIHTTIVHLSDNHFGIADLIGCEIIGGEEDNG